MKKRIAAGVLTAICFLLLTPSLTLALDTSPSSLTVIMTYGDTPLPGIHVAVCEVAAASELHGNVVFTATPDFAGAGADFTNLTTAEQNVAQARSLDAYAVTNKVARSAQVTDSEGKAKITDLEAGLYLVAQTDAAASEYTTDPYLVVVPGPGDASGSLNHDVIAYPKADLVKQVSSTASTPVSSAAQPTSSAAGSYTLPHTQGDTNNTTYGMVKTNDASNMPLWTALISMGGVGLIAVVCVLNSKRLRRVFKRK